jgi:hypothetical protein
MNEVKTLKIRKIKKSQEGPANAILPALKFASETLHKWMMLS